MAPSTCEVPLPKITLQKGFAIAAGFPRSPSKPLYLQRTPSSRSELSPSIRRSPNELPPMQLFCEGKRLLSQRWPLPPAPSPSGGRSPPGRHPIFEGHYDRFPPSSTRPSAYKLRIQASLPVSHRTRFA